MLLFKNRIAIGYGHARQGRNEGHIKCGLGWSNCIVPQIDQSDETNGKNVPVVIVDRRAVGNRNGGSVPWVNKN